MKDGLLPLKSAYLITKYLNPLNPDTHPCQWVLEMNTTPRIKFFLWLCSQNSIPTREVLGSRGFNHDTMCEVCERAFESITHVLRDCLEVSNVWKGLGIRDTNQVFYGLPLMDWLKSNCSSSVFFFFFFFFSQALDPLENSLPTCNLSNLAPEKQDYLPIWESRS